MGREVRRVPMDFAWPIGMTWKGFVNPYRSQRCESCSGCGLNPETKQISDDWYDSAQTGRRWSHAITQDEVQALVDHSRLRDFTHDFIPGNGWQPKDPPVIPTAAEVNEQARLRGAWVHDSINCWICVETRAKRLGVWGECSVCDGHGEIWHSEEIRKAAEKWEGYGPPTGDAWQLWETTSEGSPMSPPCQTPEALARWLTDNGASTFGSSTADYVTWLRFIVGPGWAPSAVSDAAGFRSGVEAATKPGGE